MSRRLLADCCASPTSAMSPPGARPPWSSRRPVARGLAHVAALPAEQVSVADAVGRVLAEDVAARRTQPPFAVSAMDGYAVRAEDVAAIPATLRIVTEIPAGAGYGGAIGAGGAARTFTGAPLHA